MSEIEDQTPDEQGGDPHKSGLTETERAVLDLEEGWWKYAGVKESTIREKFGWSTTRYYQVLNRLLDRPEAMAYTPLTVKRLRRIRDARQARRSAKRLEL